MEFDLKKKIELHGAAVKKDIIFSQLRIIVLLLAFAIILNGGINIVIVLVLLFYAAVITFNSIKKIEKSKMLYTFAKGNPAYDNLSAYGSPDEIVNEINSQINGGKIIYNALAKPGKTPPETAITEDYFIHLNKKAAIIPLKEIVCAYEYDPQTKESPYKLQTPSRFKPLYLAIAYGEGKEEFFIHTSLNSKIILEILDKKLSCKVEYTRELGTLYKKDYAGFLKKLGEVKERFAAGGGTA